MKVLFLTSWFPSKMHPTLGNFVVRHLRAIECVGQEVLVVHQLNSKKIIRSRIAEEEYDGIKIQRVYVSTLFGKGMDHSLKEKVLQLAEDFEPDIIHGNIIYPIGLLASFLSDSLKVPMVFTEHWSVFKPVNEELYTQDMHDVTLETSKRLAYLMPVSADLGESIKNKGVDVKQKVIYNSVDTEIFFPTLESKRERFTFLHISNFDQRAKNTEGIIKAFSKLEIDSDLIIAGDGDLARLKKFTLELGLNGDKVQFLGTMAYEQVAKLMQSCHVHVLFSNFENMPCVVAESLSCGLPNIATKVGGLPEIISDTNGILIEPKDTEALTNAMKMVFDRYPDYSPSNISDDAKSKFGLESIGFQFTEIYKKALLR